jgi:hypothetical protein
MILLGFLQHYRRKSGKHLLVLRFSQFDPSRKSQAGTGQPLYLSLADIDAQRLSLRQRSADHLFTPGRLARPKPSSAAGDGNSQQERN